MATIAFTILPFVPLIAWIVLVGWSPTRTEGEVLFKVPVPLLARLKMHLVPFVAGLVIAIWGVFQLEVSGWILVMFFAIYAGIVAIPTSYTLTTLGIRNNHGVFRRWTEFAGVSRSKSGVTLQGGQRAPSYPIFLSGNRDDDEFVRTLRILVRDSYKGKAINREDLQRAGSHSDGGTRITSSINH